MPSAPNKRRPRKPSRLSLVVAVLTLALAVGLEAGRTARDWGFSVPVVGDPPSPGDEVAVMALFETFSRAWAEGDAAGVAATFEPDLDWTNAYGRTIRTRGELQAYLRAQFAFPGDEGLAAGDLGAAEVGTLRYLGDEVAVLQWMARDARGGRAGGVHVTLIARKAGGEWRLVSHTATRLRD